MTYDALHLLFLFCCLVIQIVLPPHLENVRDKLAENIHELWGMNKIELGWMYGKVGKHLRGHNRISQLKHDHLCMTQALISG